MTVEEVPDLWFWLALIVVFAAGLTYIEWQFRKESRKITEAERRKHETKSRRVHT